MGHTDGEELTFMQKARNNWNGFRHFMWNSEEKTVMGRGGKSWAKVSLFYFVYYSCLAGFWAALLAIFLQTISVDRPKWTAFVSTPGLNSIPVPDDDNRIAWEPDNPETYKGIIGAMKEIYDGLLPPIGDLEDCTSQGVGSIKDGQRFCGFDVDMLKECNSPPNFGWDSLKPCIFVRLNRVFGWTPENYANEDDIPLRLRKKNIYKNNNVAIDCFPRRERDEENLNFTRPFPEAGIPFGFFPYVLGINMEDRARLIQPIIAVQISLLRHNEMVNMECQAYAGNLSPRRGLFDTDEESRFRIYLTARKEE